MKKYRWHLIVIVVYFTYEYSADRILYDDMTLLKEAIFFVTQNVYLFYGTLFALKNFQSQNFYSIIISIVRWLCILTFYIAMRYWIRYYIMATYFEKEYGNLSIKEWVTTSVIWIVNYTIFASAYFHYLSSMRKNQRLREAWKERATAAQVQLKLENDRLRAQINPHFLFNTLTLFYKEVRKTLPETAEGILALSEIMSMTLREPDGQGFIPLDKEVEGIKHLLFIHRLRNKDITYINLSEAGIYDGLNILPHTLITLVENGLKHGKICDPAHPISINIAVTAEQLSFSVYNKKQARTNVLSHGMGIMLLRRQLAYTYKNRFTLDIQEDTESYSATLDISL